MSIIIKSENFKNRKLKIISRPILQTHYSKFGFASNGRTPPAEIGYKKNEGVQNEIEKAQKISDIQNLQNGSENNGVNARARKRRNIHELNYRKWGKKRRLIIQIKGKAVEMKWLPVTSTAPSAADWKLECGTHKP